MRAPCMASAPPRKVLPAPSDQTHPQRLLRKNSGGIGPSCEGTESRMCVAHARLATVACCTAGLYLFFIIFGLSILGLLLLVQIVVMTQSFIRDMSVQAIRIRGSGAKPILTLDEGQRYHLFLSRERLPLTNRSLCPLALSPPDCPQCLLHTTTKVVPPLHVCTNRRRVVDWSGRGGHHQAAAPASPQ